MGSGDLLKRPPKSANKRPTVGVLASWPVYSGTLNTLLSPILRGLRDAAEAGGCNLLIACGVAADFATSIRAAWPTLSPETDFLPVGAWNTDGLIVIAPLESDSAQSKTIHELQAVGHPLVFVETSDMGPAVCVDNAGGIRQALAHLKAHGHRRVAFISGETGRRGDSLERLQAFQTCCQELGLESDPQLVCDGHFTTLGGYAAMRRILDNRAAFTAVLACNDESAVGAMQALRESGRHIPQDVAVVGFDNRFEARNQDPPLTTIHQPAYDIGRQSLELMLHYLAQGGRAKPEAIARVPTQLVVRESCGCKPGSIPVGSPSTSVSLSDWTDSISSAVFAQVGQLHQETVHQLSTGLVEGFTLSLERADAAPFQAALQEILEQVKTLDEDAHAWQVAIQYLRQRWLEPGRSGLPADPGVVSAVLEWLDQARMAISECAQYQLLRFLSRQNTFTQQLSLMSAELSETVELGQIQAILNHYVPGLGIRHARLVLFEAEEAGQSQEDPVAWSLVPGAAAEAGESIPRRFTTRSFPPEGFYPDALPYQLALLPLLIQKKPAGFVAFDASNLYPCLAVTRQVASTLENIRLYHEAVKGRQLAEEANRLKSRFLSTVSHELRTPLNLIVGWSEALLEEPGTDAPRFARHIHTSAQHLGRLIRDVLDLASSDAGQLRLTCEPLDLGEALQMVIETGREMATEKGLDWKTDIPTGLPLVWGDRTRLQQVTLNLISNAIKFTAKGRVMLQIGVRANEVEVAVRDTGLGVSPAEQTWIFDEFRQSERTTARGYGGLGLGLAISRRLVELHGGHVGVHSIGEEGAGSTFYYRIPILDNARPASEAQQHKVLIVTRQAQAGQPIRDRLIQAGFSVEQLTVDENQVPDWRSRLLVSPPGAVVLDESMASQYGWELLKVFKGNPRTANIPLLFYSLDGKSETGSMLALDYLMKPIRSEELLQALARQGLVSGEAGQAKTILIVDDDPGMLEINARMLQEHFPGHRVLRAGGGRTALELLSKVRVDLILLDLLMPEVDGFDVLSRLRERESTRETAVVVLTSKTLTEADMSRLSHGVAMVMGKGLYAAQEMFSYIEAALAHSHRLGSESQRLVRKAMAYIHENYARTVTRAQLARHVNVSDGHLARCFRQETGLTPMDYLNRYRINQSQNMLASSRQSITAIALACGFSNVNYFSRVFRQETGVSPLAYRRKHQV